MKRRAYLSSIALPTIAGCIENAPPSTPTRIAEDGQTIKKIPLPNNDEMWAYADYGNPNDDIKPNELDSLLPYYVRKTGKTKPSNQPDGLHPLVTNRQLRSVVESALRHDRYEKYEPTIDRLSKAFVDVATVYENGLYFPYDFEFAVHGRDTLELGNPWYSGMAQGEILGTWARLYDATGKDSFREYAEKTYASLVDIADTTADRPWVSTRDQDGYYWIEEYPDDPAANTLNGKLFAIFGLCEYYRVTGSNKVRETVNAALTTLLDHMEEFRVSGGVSYYCLGHDVQSESYHQIHVHQLEHLYKLTEYESFKGWANRLREDYWPE